MVEVDNADIQEYMGRGLAKVRCLTFRNDVYDRWTFSQGTLQAMQSSCRRKCLWKLMLAWIWKETALYTCIRWWTDMAKVRKRSSRCSWRFSASSLSSCSTERPTCRICLRRRCPRSTTWELQRSALNWSTLSQKHCLVRSRRPRSIRKRMKIMNCCLNSRITRGQNRKKSWRHIRICVTSRWNWDIESWYISFWKCTDILRITKISKMPRKGCLA